MPAGVPRHFYACERGRLDTLAAFPTMEHMRRWVALAPHRRYPVVWDDPGLRAARQFERRTGIKIFLRPDMTNRP